MSELLGEFFGTMVMVALGVGTGAAVNLKKSYAKNANWFYIIFAWGLAVTFGVYVAANFGSKAHLNPAVTLGMAVGGYFPWDKVFTYIVAQFIGAFFGGLIPYIHYYAHFKETKNEVEGNHVGIFATGPATNSPIFNFIDETIDTFIFVFVLIHLGNFGEGLKPFIAGFLVIVIGLALGPTTGLAMNPARDWSPRLVYTIFPVPYKSTANWSYAWVPMCGPLLGGILAALLNYSLQNYIL